MGEQNGVTAIRDGRGLSLVDKSLKPEVIILSMFHRLYWDQNFDLVSSLPRPLSMPHSGSVLRLRCSQGQDVPLLFWEPEDNGDQVRIALMKKHLSSLPARLAASISPVACQSRGCICSSLTCRCQTKWTIRSQATNPIGKGKSKPEGKLELPWVVLLM